MPVGVNPFSPFVVIQSTGLAEDQLEDKLRGQRIWITRMRE